MEEPLTYEHAVEQMLTRIPELEPVYLRLLEEEGAPVLAFALLGDSVRFAYELCRKRGHDLDQDRQVEDTLRRLMGYLEDGLGASDPLMHDFVGTGFIEIMDPDDPCFSYLKSLMGPLSRHDTDVIFGPEWRRTR